MDRIVDIIDRLNSVNYSDATISTKKLIDFLNDENNRILTLDKRTYLLELISNKNLHGIKNNDIQTLIVLIAIDDIWNVI